MNKFRYSSQGFHKFNDFHKFLNWWNKDIKQILLSLFIFKIYCLTWTHNEFISNLTCQYKSEKKTPFLCKNVKIYAKSLTSQKTNIFPSQASSSRAFKTPKLDKFSPEKVAKSIQILYKKGFKPDFELFIKT